jgi:HK97 family phage prohead protease
LVSGSRCWFHRAGRVCPQRYGNGIRHQVFQTSFDGEDRQEKVCAEEHSEKTKEQKGMSSENVRELRFISKELRAAKGDSPKLAGLAARFNSPTEISGLFIEKILPGAFSATLAGGADVRALFNHNADAVLGRTKNNTLRLWESSVGLEFECDLPNTTVAKDVYAMVQRGDVSQCSFGFTVDAEHWIPATRAGELPTRELQSVSLFDVTIACTYPAYDATSVEARSAQFPAGTAFVERSAAKAAAVTAANPSVQFPELATDEELDRLYRRAHFLN